MHFSEQIQRQLHFPSPTENYPSGAQISFPRNFLALKILGKAQECDFSVTGHLIVDKPFRWLISCYILGCSEALPVCTLTLLAASSQPMQMLSNRHIHVCILLTRLYREVSWLTALTKRCLSFSLLQDLTSGSHGYFQFPSLLEFPNYQRL